MKATTAIHLWEVTNDVSPQWLTDDEVETIVGVFAPYWHTHNQPMLRQEIPAWLASIGAPEGDIRIVMARLMALTGKWPA